jgi:hypothetical protein
MIPIYKTLIIGLLLPDFPSAVVLKRALYSLHNSSVVINYDSSPSELGNKQQLTYHVWLKMLKSAEDVAKNKNNKLN